MPANERYKVVQTIEAFRAMKNDLREASIIGFDLETSGFDYIDDVIVGWAFAVREGAGYYVPVRHSFGENMDPDMVVRELKPILEDPKKVFTIHNAKFDTRFTRNAGIEMVYQAVEDTLLEAYVGSHWDGTERFGLKELEANIFHVKAVSFDDLFPKGTKKKNIANVDIDTAGYYACADADYCLRLHNRYAPKLIGNFIYRLEKELWPLVQTLEERGVLVDPDALRRMASYIREEAAKVEKIVLDQVEQMAGARYEFSIGSTKQLANILYEVLGLPVIDRSAKTGEPSTAENTLKQLVDRGYIVCHNILMYRSMKSNAGSMEGWIEKISPHDGRIHTNYNQAGATSGRFASSDPNVQNIGKSKEWTINRIDGTAYTVTVNPRDAFLAAPGKYLIELDFKAIEFIIFAALAGEDAVVRMYESGGDVHKQTASDVSGKPYDSISKPERDLSKTVNYATVYGASAKRISEETGRPVEECQAFLDRFFQVRPKFQQFMQATRDKAVKSKKVSTLFGRDQLVPEFFEPGKQAASKALRACVNRRIQGTAADVQKMGILRVWRKAVALWVEEMARMILQTHDSQTWEVDRSIPPHEIVPTLVTEMSKRLPGLPKIDVDANIGVTWGSLMPYEGKGSYLAALEEGKTWEEVLDRMDRARLETLEKMPEPVEVEVQSSFEEIIANQHNNGAGVRILLRLGMKPTAEVANQLKLVLKSFPGNNVVALVVDGRDDVALTNMPTSLSAREVAEAIRPFAPVCTAEVDKASLLAAVVGV